jgi:predicted dehydrogenase
MMAERLGMGVIGLGRRWPRYRQALAVLRREVRVTAVHDPAGVRAGAEARQLGCACAGGVVELAERDDVDAVLLVGGSWFGLWPVERVIQAGKPVLCAGSLVRDDEHIDGLAGRLGPSAAVHAAVWPAFHLLHEAVVQTLGELAAPRLSHASRVATGPHDVLASSAALALVGGMAELFDSAPEAVTVQAPGGRTSFASVVLEFPHERIGQLTLWAGPAEASRTWLEVETEAGALRAELPRQLSWRDDQGRHALEMPGGLAEVWVVDRFVQAVRGEGGPVLPFAQAYQALTWLRAARRSRNEGRRVEIAAP